MTWSSEQKEGEGAKAQTEETAMTAALIRAFRAVDEEVVGSVRPCLLSICPAHPQQPLPALTCPCLPSLTPALQ